MGDAPASMPGGIGMLNTYEPSRFAAGCLARTLRAFPERLALPTRCGRGPSGDRPRSGGIFKMRPIAPRQRSEAGRANAVAAEVYPRKKATGTRDGVAEGS